MKEYPPIEYNVNAAHNYMGSYGYAYTKYEGQYGYAFIKYDGSNIRVEWGKKTGWNKYGSRTKLIDASHPHLGEAIPLFENKYADALEQVFKTDKLFKGVDTVTVFLEFFGTQSFAGVHVEGDPKDLVLFDVNPIKKGILGPRQFLDSFGHLPVAEVVWEGVMDGNYLANIRINDIDLTSKYTIKQPIPEGVVVKGGEGHKLWMTKIKTAKYLQTLKDKFGNDWENHV